MGLKIGFISASPPSDKRASSGTCYKMAKALGGMGEVIWIPIHPSRVLRFLELLSKATARLFRRNISFQFTELGASLWARRIDTSYFDECDLLFAFWGGNWLGGVQTKGKPVIYVSDATFQAMIGYYPPFCKLFDWNIREGISIERRSFDKASKIVLSSDWAARSAIEHGKQPAEKVVVIEFGANIEDADIRPHHFSYHGHLDILFLGVEWQRKGGSIAVEATRWLNENGIEATLHIVGIRMLDEKIAALPYIDNVGFLNKNRPDEYHRLEEIISQCHLLLLPTVAECAGIAFAEASAYGLPTFTHYTGGIPSYMENGYNGYMLPLGSTGSEFGEKIKDSLLSGELERMSSNAVELYRIKLNWHVWGSKMKQVIESLMFEESE